MNPASPQEPQRSSAPRWTLALCTALLLCYAILAGTAANGKSPTADESYHALAGWLHLWHDDYRLDTEDPPLWDELAALTTGPNTVNAEPPGDAWGNLPMDTSQEYQWQVDTLFRTPGNEAIGFINRFRLAMLAVAVALGALLAWSTWRIARADRASPRSPAIAAIVATTLFAFDPNFLAHGALMKNDVAAALAMLGLVITVWALGRRMTIWRVILLGIWAGIALGVKFTGPLLVGIAAVLLLLRALVFPLWLVRRARILRNRAASLAMAVGVVLAMGIIAWGILWLSYGLHYAPGRQLWAHLNLGQAVFICKERWWQAHHTDGFNLPIPTNAQIAATPIPPVVKVALWIDHWHLVPQAFAAGLLYTYQSSLIRGTFLCGKVRCVGWWWYFPFAMAVKTPLATMAAIAIAAAVGLVIAKRGRFADFPNGLRGCPIHVRKQMVYGIDPNTSRIISFVPRQWTAICIIVPIAIYMAALMNSNLNLGLRHVLPVYPLLYLGVGIAAAQLWEVLPRTAIAIAIPLAIGLVAAAVWAYPNFIPFFNLIAGGPRGGLRLLSDSNLDWGQDLPLMADWQRRHRDEKLYFAYFGTADPAYFGIRYTNIAQGYWKGPPPEPIVAPGVIAISATILQGPYTGQINGQPYYAGLWKIKPMEVLGGSIYLFRWPPTKADLLPKGKQLIN